MKINFQTQRINPYKFSPSINHTRPVMSPRAEYFASFKGDIQSAGNFSNLQAIMTKNSVARAEFYSGNLYKRMLITNPDMAFLYNPDLTAKEKTLAEEQSDIIFTQSSLAKKMGLHTSKIIAWRENGPLEFEEVPNISKNSRHFYGTAFYININSDANKEFIEYIESILPHSIPGEVLMCDYNFTQDEIPRLVKRGQLKPAGFSDVPENFLGPYNLLFDMEDEVNKDTFQKHLRTVPVPSKIYGENGKRRFVPVGYLQKLGYGDIKTLALSVKDGKLPGKMIQTAPGQYKVLVDVSQEGVKAKLRTMRYQNPDIVDIEEFAKEAGITRTALKKALEEDEAELIGEYIFKDDYKERLLNKKSPKNRAFLDKAAFERAIEENHRAERREKIKKERIARIQNPIESLRRTIVWAMCPYTKMVAGQVASADGYARKVLDKINEEGMETLTPVEQRKHRSYCKTYWGIAGSEEYSEAHRRAKIIIEQFKTGGIDAVEDPEIKEVIERFLRDFEGVWTPDIPSQKP